MKKPAPRAGTTADGRKRPRPHQVPKWLRDSQHLNEIARSRCLMVLTVLSGEKPVTQAIAQAKISRGTYYQMETRALNAMLTALNPLATVSQTAVPDLSATRIAALMSRIQHLEQEKRRTQRLLLLTRKSIRAPLKTGLRGRLPTRALLGSMPIGKPLSRSSKAKAITIESSTPTGAGEAVR